MKNAERELLIACGRAIKEISKVVHHITIPAMNPIDFQVLDTAVGDIDYSLNELGVNE